MKQKLIPQLRLRDAVKVASSVTNGTSPYTFSKEEMKLLLFLGGYSYDYAKEIAYVLRLR